MTCKVLLLSVLLAVPVMSFGLDRVIVWTDTARANLTLDELEVAYCSYIKKHKPLSSEEQKAATVEYLSTVTFDIPVKIINEYPSFTPPNNDVDYGTFFWPYVVTAQDKSQMLKRKVVVPVP